MSVLVCKLEYNVQEATCHAVDLEAFNIVKLRLLLHRNVSMILGK